jgi:hypothetical protein
VVAARHDRTFAGEARRDGGQVACDVIHVDPLAAYRRGRDPAGTRGQRRAADVRGRMGEAAAGASSAAQRHSQPSDPTDIEALEGMG